MITYPEAYQIENNKAEKTPSTIVEIVESGIEDLITPDGTLDVNGSPTASVTSGVGHADQVHNLAHNAFGDIVLSSAYQSFKMPAFRSANITSIKVWLETDGSPFGGSQPKFTGTLYLQVFSDSSLTVALTNEHSISVELTKPSISDYTVSFSGETFNFINDVQYYIKIRVSGSFNFAPPDGFGELFLLGANAGGYADGTLGGGSKDADFTANLGSMYDNYITPTVIEYDLDLGEVPTEDGEWTIKDTHETGTAAAYTAEYSATGAFGGEEVSMGTIVDGDAITDLYQYYRVTATLTTTVPHSSSVVVQIKASFESLIKISDSAYWGHAPDYISANSVTKTIDDFKASTIGQVSFKTAYSALIRDFIETKFPKGNTVKIKKGFISDTFTEADFIDHYLGRIENYSVGSDDIVTFTLKDFQRDLSTKIPIIGTNGATTDIEYTAEHPVTVMLDIIQDRVGIRTSKVDVASFDAVVTALSGWVVTRNAANNNALVEPEEAQKLLEELRLITNTYFIPQNDGKIVLKQWDSSEVSVRTFLQSDFISFSYDANMAALYNFVLIYYDWDGSGTNPSDFGAGSGSVDATSLANWGLTEIKQLKDRWTLAAQTTQVETARNNLQNRYKDPPPLITCTVDSKHSDVEVGDVVDVTHSRLQHYDNFEFDPTSWELAGALNVAKSRATSQIIGDYVYIFGGDDISGVTDTIIKAPLSNPTDWSSAGTLSEKKSYAVSHIIGDYVYIFGGHNGTIHTDTIIKAPLSDPTSWSSAGTLSEKKSHATSQAIEDYIYIFSGYGPSGNTNTVIKAPLSDPTSWSAAGTTSEIKLYATSEIIGGYVYLHSGYNGSVVTDTVIKAPLSDPTSWSAAGTTSEIKLYATSKIIGDYVYIFGGSDDAVFYTDTVIKAPLSDPTSWSSATALSEIKGKATLQIIGDYVYIFGGNDDDGLAQSIIKSLSIIRRFQVISVNPTTRNTINLKLLGMGA